MGIGSIGFQELIIIFLIVAFLFGAKRIPEIARGFGQAIKEFKKAIRSSEDSDKVEYKEEEQQRQKKDEESNRKV